MAVQRHLWGRYSRNFVLRSIKLGNITFSLTNVTRPTANSRFRKKGWVDAWLQGEEMLVAMNCERWLPIEFPALWNRGCVKADGNVENYCCVWVDSWMKIIVDRCWCGCTVLNCRSTWFLASNRAEVCSTKVLKYIPTYLNIPVCRLNRFTYNIINIMMKTRKLPRTRRRCYRVGVLWSSWAEHSYNQDRASLTYLFSSLIQTFVA